MRTLGWVLVVALVSACASVRVQKITKTDFTVCGNKWAEETDLQKLADKQCHGKADRQEIESTVTGYQTQAVGKTLITQPTTGLCARYTCLKAE